MVTRHSSALIETISRILSLAQCPQPSSSTSLLDTESHILLDEPASYDPEDLPRAAHPIGLLLSVVGDQDGHCVSAAAADGLRAAQARGPQSREHTVQRGLVRQRSRQHRVLSAHLNQQGGERGAHCLAQLATRPRSRTSATVARASEQNFSPSGELSLRAWKDAGHGRLNALSKIVDPARSQVPSPELDGRGGGRSEQVTQVDQQVIEAVDGALRQWVIGEGSGEADADAELLGRSPGGAIRVTWH
jgi:hypothetical protein